MPKVPKISSGARVDTAAVIMAALHEKHGNDSAIYLGSGHARGTVTDVIATGIDVLDHHVLGCGGLPLKRISEVFSDPSRGKAQPVDCQVLTPTGFRAIGSLCVGDIITDPDTGGEQTVDGVFPQGERVVFEIHTTDGAMTRSCAEHLWKVFTHADKQRDTGGRVLSTAQLLEHGLRRANSGSARNVFCLPELAPVNFTDPGALPLDPYLLGLLLGDGSFDGSCIRFFKPEPDLWDRVAELVPLGDQIRPLTDEDEGIRIISEAGPGHHVTSLTHKCIVSLGLHGATSLTKFVPEAYLTSSVEDRLRLLQGLFDTDGSVRGSGGSIEYSSSSQYLAHAVIQLVRSLGGLASFNSRVPVYTYKGEKKRGALSWRVNARLPEHMCPVSSEKHLATWVARVRTTARYITGIYDAGSAECVCIKVSGKSKTYVTDDFIITHNTAFGLHCLAKCQHEGGTAILADSENALSPERAEMHGLDIGRLLMIESDTLEEVTQRFLDALEAIPDGSGPVLAVWDSLASSPTTKEIEEGLQGKDKVGERAKHISKAFRQLPSVVAKKNAHLMVINQIRQNIGVMFGDDTVTPGGEAVKFHASIRLKIMGGEAEKDPYGDHISMAPIFMAVKNKMHPPFRKARVKLNFDTGWDNAWSTLYFAKERKLIEPRARGNKAIVEAYAALGWRAPDLDEVDL